MTSPGITDQNTGRTVVGLFQERSHAEQAIRDLKDAGFQDDQIGVAMQDRGEQKDLMESTGAQAAEGAATGAVSGGLVGGIIGLLGSLLIPGVGPIVVGGVLASTLTGAGIGAAAGGLIGALVGMGVPEEDAQHFDTGLRSGGILLTVNARERTAEAVAILQQNEADLGPSGPSRFRGTADADLTDTDLSTRTAGLGTGTAGFGTGTADVDQTQRLELREEQLEVEKERVQAGEVRLHKEVVTEQRTVEVPVTREELVIERRPAGDREVTASDIGQDEEIRIPLMEEQVNVEKQAVVREEVSVGKRKVQETREISDTVRREEARIETEGQVNMRPLEGQRTRAYQGKERRRRQDASYAGPERRLVGV